MNKQEILAFASRDPRFQQGADILEAKLSQMQVTPEMLQELVQTLEFVLANPDRYPEVREKAIAKGFVTDQDIPPTFNKVFVVSLLIALYAMQDRLEQGSPAFKRGGLAQYGRSGDTMLAHINPMEAEVLRRMGGSNTVNPNTGIREFKGGGLGTILSAIIPVALDFIAPDLGAAISGSFGDVGKQAIYGAAGAALGGGDWKQGALAGAMQGGLGNMAGEALGNATGMSSGMANLASNALLGGAAGALGEQGFGKGALQGLAGGALGQMTQGTKFEGMGQTAGNLLTSGATPQNALVGGALAGLANTYMRPSDAVTAPANGNAYKLWTAGESAKLGAPQAAPSGDTSTSSAPSTGFDFKNMTGMQMLSAAPALLSIIGAAQTPAQVQQAVAQMSPEQQKYFSRPSQKWDWAKLQADAAQAGMGLGQYMATNWNKLTADQAYVPQEQKLAQGGLSMLMSGGGSGRDDTIDAKLSDGEYVFDAETVALLGDGSTDEGAARLDQMRSAIRAHKGKTLAKGKISPDAKSPLAYLKEVA